MPLQLLRSVSIQQGAILVNGVRVLEGQPTDFASFSQQAYRHLRTDYQKFHKMDNLSKLGFLAAEYLLANTDLLAGFTADKIGLVVANNTSSTDTDLRYNAQVQQQVASPALFVYTLPNIVLGEICIRHGFKGENMLFVADKFDAKTQVQYIQQLFAHNIVTACVGGWLDYFDNQYRAFLYVVCASSDAALTNYTAPYVHALYNT